MASADILTFPDVPDTVHECELPNDQRSGPAPCIDTMDGSHGALAGASALDSRERLFRHLIRLHGLVG